MGSGHHSQRPMVKTQQRSMAIVLKVPAKDSAFRHDGLAKALGEDDRLGSCNDTEGFLAAETVAAEDCEYI